MSNKSKSDTTASNPNAETNNKPTAKPFQGALQKAADIETAQGFRGVEVDSTPNENYTVAGVTAGKPTPETETIKRGDK